MLNKNGIYDKQIFRPFIENLYSWKLCMRMERKKENFYGHWTLKIEYAIYIFVLRKSFFLEQYRIFGSKTKHNNTEEKKNKNPFFFHKTMLLYFFLLPFFVIYTREFIYFLLYFNSSSEKKVTFHASIAFHMHIHNNENEKYFGLKKKLCI